MTRHELLKHAEELVYGEREGQYGTPMNMLTRIAEYWTTYLGFSADIALNPHDVAAMMILLKVSRMKGSGATTDTWADIAGYAAIGAEVQDMAVGVELDGITTTE